MDHVFFIKGSMIETDNTQKITPISSESSLKERKKTPKEDKENPEQKQKDKKILEIALNKISKKRNFYSGFVINKNNDNNIDPRILQEQIFSKK